tara:strand:- start:1041 stop:1697 length:657 start_codon:yes stop_codon:yes gene_type:complete
MMKTSVLIVAGGSGSRFKNTTPKQFLIIKDKPLLMHTIERFSHLHEIYVVLPKNHVPLWEELCKNYNFEIKHTVVFGGGNRFTSVKNGLTKIKNTNIVLIHDGVRPVVSKKLIENLVNSVDKNIGVIPVVGSNESIRYIDKTTSKAVNRENYYKVQTPQCFLFNEIFKAYSQEFNQTFTDDASVFESTRENKIITVKGEIDNIKITYPKDIHLVNTIL